jgi:ketosteroid isomerase-like protein
MPRAKHQAASLQGSPDDVEAAFYEALQAGDVERLMACWADEDDIVCVHPGGPRVVGGPAIRASFEAIFVNGSIRAWPERVRRVDSLSSSVHNLIERIDVMTDDGLRHAYVIATNVYLKTAMGWRLVAHHASPGTTTEASEAAVAPQTLH